MVHHLCMSSKRKTCPCTQSVVLQFQCNQHAANSHIYHTVPAYIHTYIIILYMHGRYPLLATDTVIFLRFTTECTNICHIHWNAYEHTHAQHIWPSTIISLYCKLTRVA